MDALESRVAVALREQGESAPPPPAGLAHRIHRCVRRRRFSQATAGGTAAVLAAGLVGVASGLLGLPSSWVDTPVADGHVDARTAPLPPHLAELLPGRHATVYSARLDNGELFRVTSLGDDGTLVGVDSAYDRWTATMVLDTQRQRFVKVDDSEPEFLSGGSPAGDATMVAWVGADSEGDYVTYCRDLPTSARRASGGYISEGRLVWNVGPLVPSRRWGGDITDPNAEVWTSKGCASGQATGLRGELAGYDYPYVYLRDDAYRIVAVNLRTRTERALHPLGPTRAQIYNSGRGGIVGFARGHHVQSWNLKGGLYVNDGTGASGTERLSQPPPGRHGLFSIQTIGDRFVAALSPGINDKDPKASDGEFRNGRGLVYDLKTKSWMPLPGQAWAVGPWLAWRDGTSYHIVNTSPDR